MSAPDYFPLKENWRYTYNFTSSDFSGTATVHIDILDVRKEENKISANARMTFILRDTHVTKFEVVNDGEWLYSTNGIVTGGRKAFPIPPETGKKWVEAPDSCRIQSMDEICEIPAGKFENCMKINTMIADGDGGTASRWYA
ncbi:MAG: hypothetical protein J5706_03305, partial [Elusimicrobiales bacterium]|nr:hypothetical protein [Elusimicrobiales bacterium]